MVVDKRGGMDSLKGALAFWRENELRVGIVSNPDHGSPGIDPNTQAKDDKGRSQPKTVGEIAVIHELGLGHMPDDPPRSFIAATMDNDARTIEDSQATVVDAVLAGKVDAETALRLLGEDVLEAIKQRIRNKIPPELTDERKAQKVRAGRPGDTPLVNFGQLINSVRYSVNKSK